ncbi:MAG: hypothetical protein A4E60_01696 [Syntrophorhabdus sp. PtaB.Bin047]|nr:MAG: hypothetical protein A4E60_01696 [Syntrophorhabdus sp. PtaB.Bin047]
MRPEKQTPTPAELRRMLSKHSGEHAEKCTTYGAVLILVILGALLPTWSPVLWAVSGLLMGLVAPIAGIILALVVLKSLFHFVIERLPGADGAGR